MIPFLDSLFSLDRFPYTLTARNHVTAYPVDARTFKQENKGRFDHAGICTFAME